MLSSCILLQETYQAVTSNWREGIGMLRFTSCALFHYFLLSVTETRFCIKQNYPSSVGKKTNLATAVEVFPCLQKKMHGHKIKRQNLLIKRGQRVLAPIYSLTFDVLSSDEFKLIGMITTQIRLSCQVSLLDKMEEGEGRSGYASWYKSEILHIKHLVQSRGL